MAKHPFLSEDWMAEAKKIREEYAGKSAAAPQKMKMNQIITDVPFGDGTINAHMDSSSGEMDMDLGHLDDAEVTITIDYPTAKAIFVDGNPQAGMQAFMAGKIKVQGDMTKLLAVVQAPPESLAGEAQRRIADITA